MTVFVKALISTSGRILPAPGHIVSPLVLPLPSVSFSTVLLSASTSGSLVVVISRALPWTAKRVQTGTPNFLLPLKTMVIFVS